VVKVGIVGGTGYTGVELLRLLAMHPNAGVSVITSRTEAGTRVDTLFPSLRGYSDLVFCEPDIQMLSACDVVFFATPNGTAMKLAPEILQAGVRVIDLAADFRLKDAEVWRHWYGNSHTCVDLLTEAVYGLPEINREAIRTAQLVANPGCYPTAIILGFLPLVERGIIDNARLIADAKSGVSGAGRKASLSALLCEASENVKAYSVPGHRHLPEIVQGLEQISAKEIGLTFVPHLMPMIRGIHATLYAMTSNADIDLQNIFVSRYSNEPFVDVMPRGAHPETRSVRGANICRIAVHRPQTSDTVVILSVIDNLIKGAAGQAVQNMNLMFGYDEHLGLQGAPWVP
jgi:N-acetyl-gamma-glutamyl-phosphate reductase